VLLVAVQTGLRSSELIHPRRRDARLETRAKLRCEGKGRKQRYTPLPQDAAAPGGWLDERQGEPRARPSSRSSSVAF